MNKVRILRDEETGEETELSGEVLESFNYFENIIKNQIKGLGHIIIIGTMSDDFGEVKPFTISGESISVKAVKIEENKPKRIYNEAFFNKSCRCPKDYPCSRNCKPKAL